MKKKEETIDSVKSYLEKVRDFNSKIDKHKPQIEDMIQMRKKETQLLFNLNTLRLMQEFLQEKEDMLEDSENEA